jgi:hypothetical protein
MSYYAVVVKDAQLAHDQEIARNIDANVQAHGEEHRKRIDRAIRQRYQHAPRPSGALHCHGERGCPDGEPWCEHCGDPAFVESCLAAGHCEACVTLRHGAVAHPAVLEANGYELVEVGIEALEPHPAEAGRVRVRSGHVWDDLQRRFLKH